MQLGALEAQYALKYNKSITLSTQQLIDCGTEFSVALEGCNGGHTWTAFLYANETGVARDSDYPYVAKDQKCNKNVTILKFPMKDFVVLHNETDLQDAIGRNFLDLF